MTISATDVKILKSERLTDYDDGGGKMTGLEVVDGVMNNLFPDISRLDRTYGRVSLRKAFAAIRALTTDTYYGAHAIITEPPLDDNVSVTMFSTNSYADERTNARDRIESYLTPSIESRYVLFGNHLTGSTLLSVYCDPKVPAPEIGDVYAFRHLNQVTDDDSAVTLYTQYQRIQRLISRVNGDYIVANSSPPRVVNVDVLVMEVSSVFQQDFPGAAPTDILGSPAKTKINQTNATDAARYFGVTRLASPAAVGDFSLNVADVYASLVPSAQSEVPIIDQPAAGSVLSSIAAANAPLTAPAPLWPANVATTCYFPRGFVPGTFTLDGSTYDDGVGGYADGLVTATLNYATGKVVAKPTGNVTKTMTAVPAAPVSQTVYTSQYIIDTASRSLNYVLSLTPLPAPGAFYVDYKAQGRWYRLRDNGSGKLVGDLSSYGSGAIDYTTGSVVVTVGALPDVGTALLYGWGSREIFTIATGDDGGYATNTAAVTGANTATATGLVPDANGAVTLTLAPNLTPNTVALNYTAQQTSTDQYDRPVVTPVPGFAYDDGHGNIVLLPLPTEGMPYGSYGPPIGSVDYTTGHVTLTTQTTTTRQSHALGPSRVVLNADD